jgi:HAD superfamily hydrolase (TIGR01509 family)
MDGLMLDTERMARKALTRALADRGFQLDEASYLNLLGRSVGDNQAILTEMFGQELPFSQVFSQRQAYYEEDIAENGIPIKAGLLELLDFLEMNNIPKAVASSAPKWFAIHKLSHAGIDNRFQAIVCGDEVPMGKPAPDIFLEAARQIGVGPKCCVVLEDSEAGIRSAYSAGMLPILVPDLKPPSAEMNGLAHQIVPSLCEIRPIFEAFLRDGLPDPVRQ